MKPFKVFPLSALMACTLFLSAWGAGVFPSSTCIAAVMLCAAAAATVAVSTTRSVPPAAVLAGLAFLLALLSAVPLPARLEPMTGRLRSEQNGLVRSALAEAAEAGVIEKATPSFSHSRNRSGTLRIAVLVLLMLCAATVSAGLGTVARNAYIRFLATLLPAMAVLGFLHQWIWPVDKTIWWVFDFPHGSPVGSFVNRTHHAGFIAMVCPLTLALLVRSVTAGKIPSAIVYTTTFAIMTAAVVSSLARGAVLAAGAGTLTVLVLTARRKQWRALLFVCALVFLLTGCAAVTLHATRGTTVSRSVAERMATLKHPLQTFSGRARLSVWRDSLKIWRDYPVTGVGPNGFRMVFSLYRTRTDRQMFVTPENEYVEILVDSGITGALCAALLAALLFAQWRHSVKHSLLPDEVSMAIAGAAAAAAVHNAVDVPMHTPLYAMTFASLIGMLFPPADHREGRLFPAGLSLHPRLQAAALLAPGIAVGLCLVVCGTEPYKLDLQDTTISADAATLSRALVRAPTSWATWYHLGQAAFLSNRRQAFIVGEKCMARATDYDPRNYRLWEALGHARVSMGYEDAAREAFERMHELRAWKKPPEIKGGW